MSGVGDVSGLGVLRLPLRPRVARSGSAQDDAFWGGGLWLGGVRLAGHAFEVAVAAGGDEEGEEDGEVVAGVDEGGAGYGVGADADEGEDERDAEEDEEGGPGVG